MSDTTNPFTLPTGKRATCMEMLQMVLDGQVTPEQRAYFLAHMDNCKPCFESYRVDTTIQQLLKDRCCGGEAPQDLIVQIKAKITQKDI